MEKNLVKQILLEQKKEIEEVFKQKIIKREVEPNAKKMFASDLIKVIMGVRRCGKSVLAHQLLKDNNYGYVNFDDERLIGAKTKDLNMFFEIAKEIEPDFKYLLLDEVQNVEGWELFVNRLKRRGYNIVVSGSNSRLLAKELATHLTGRHFSIELYPFSFREFLSYKDFSIKEEDFYITEKKAGLRRLLHEYLEWGGMPELFKVEAKRSYLRELFSKIITRDIILRYNIKYAKDLEEMALYTISNFASGITYHKIRNIFEVKSVHTIKNYLGYLEEAYLLFQINPFSFKIKEQLKQPRKIYCIDSGLINVIAPKVTVDYGKLMENLVFLELKRRSKEIYFYSQPSYEIDFLIKEGLRIKQLIQVCYLIANEDTKKREIKALLRASKELSCEDLIIVTWDYEAEEEFPVRVGSAPSADKKKIKFIPLWKWLLE